MAKTQTFGDKLKKKKHDTKINLKVIKWFRDENRGSLRSMERHIRIDDISATEKLDIV